MTLVVSRHVPYSEVLLHKDEGAVVLVQKWYLQAQSLDIYSFSVEKAVL